MTSPPKPPPPAAQPNSPLLTHPFKLLGTLRLAFGISAWIFPSEIFTFLRLAPSATVLVRLIGTRDAMMALLLFNSKSIGDRDKSLFAGVAVDSMDVLASAICWYLGDLDIFQAAAVAGGASFLIALAKLRLWRR